MVNTSITDTLMLIALRNNQAWNPLDSSMALKSP